MKGEVARCGRLAGGGGIRAGSVDKRRRSLRLNVGGSAWDGMTRDGESQKPHDKHVDVRRGPADAAEMWFISVLNRSEPCTA